MKGDQIHADLSAVQAMGVPSNLTSAFVTLFVTIGPVETSAIFAGLAGSLTAIERQRVASKAVVVAGAVLFAFALCGRITLEMLHVSMPAFRVAGGVLLFLQALTLTFSSPGLSSISAGEKREASRAADMAVFPLAFPLIAGPGSLAAVVLLVGQSTSLAERSAVMVIVVACLAITYAALVFAGRLARLLGQTGADVVGRVSGVLLAALAVQFIFDGLRQASLLV